MKNIEQKCEHKVIPNRLLELQDPITKEVEEYIEWLCYECNKTVYNQINHQTNFADEIDDN